eukprot:2339726-Rhodomonas_salina.2
MALAAPARSTPATLQMTGSRMRREQRGPRLKRTARSGGPGSMSSSSLRTATRAGTGTTSRIS